MGQLWGLLWVGRQGVVNQGEDTNEVAGRHTMTITKNPTRPQIEEMYVVHRTFRRELGALPGLIRDVADGDVARARVVGGHLSLVLDGLHMHHTGEDEVLWPRLLERAAPEAALVETMQRQHELVDEGTARVRSFNDQWLGTASAIRGEQLARLVEQLDTTLFEHLDLEEREVLPLIERHITQAEWATLSEHGQELMERKMLPIFFGSLIEDTTEEERRMMLGGLPPLLRPVVRTLGVWQYRRYIRRVRAC